MYNTANSLRNMKDLAKSYIQLHRATLEYKELPYYGCFSVEFEVITVVTFETGCNCWLSVI